MGKNTPQNQSNQTSTKKTVKQQKGSRKTPQSDILALLSDDINFLIKHRNEAESEEKTQRAEQMYNKIEGIMFQIAQSKYGGRAIQLVIKCASPQLREQVFEKLLKDKRFSELIQTKYGHYIGITMIRNMVQQQKKQFYDILYKHLLHFVGQQDASVVLDRFLIKVATHPQINQMKKAFDEHNERIDNLAMKIIEKGLHNHMLSLRILRTALPKLINVEKQKVIEFFQQLDNFLYLRHKDGLDVFCAVFNSSDKKVRKNIVKNLQTYIEQTNDHLNRNSYVYLAILKSLITMDDTKYSSKALLTPILENWADNIHTYKIVTSLYSPKFVDFKYYDTIQLPNQYSLKDEDIRMRELQKYAADDVIKTLNEQNNLSIDPNLSKFAGAFFKFVVQQNYKPGLTLLKKILNELQTKTSDKIYNQDTSEYWILTNPEPQRLAKSIILLESHAEDPSIIVEFAKNIYKQLIDNLTICINSKAIYLLIALVEQSSFKQQVIDELKQKKTILQKSKSAQGMDILMKYL